MASTEASADQSKGEDIVHASRRRGDKREQGSRTGRCGWITSFLGNLERTLRGLAQALSRSIVEPSKVRRLLPSTEVIRINTRRDRAHTEPQSGDETRPFLPLFFG